MPAAQGAGPGTVLQSSPLQLLQTDGRREQTSLPGGVGAHGG